MKTNTTLTDAGPTVTIRRNGAGKPTETLVSDGDRTWSSVDQVGASLPGWVMDALVARFVRVATRSIRLVES